MFPKANPENPKLLYPWKQRILTEINSRLRDKCMARKTNPQTKITDFALERRISQNIYPWFLTTFTSPFQKQTLHIIIMLPTPRRWGVLC